MESQTHSEQTTSLAEFLAARDLLLEARSDYQKAKATFRWPSMSTINWALDFFDRVPPRGQTGLRVVDDDGALQDLSFQELTARSNQVANSLQAAGLQPRDSLLLMLGNTVELWETILAAIKLQIVVIPASTLLTPSDLEDRLERGEVRAIVAASDLTGRLPDSSITMPRFAVGTQVKGWTPFSDCYKQPIRFEPLGSTRPSDPLFLYFTSGTTARPKLVLHTHSSYPVGHLSTMYAIGLLPGDIHLNVSSPGWAKHAWSSLFAPWIAEATVLAYNYTRFDPKKLLDVLVRHHVTTICAPPTVWRNLVQEDLTAHKVVLRELLSAGEPLNPEIIAKVRRSWGLTIRDFYGQTETTALVGNTPGQPLRLGSMGRPLPGYKVVLLDSDGGSSDEGEICIDLGDGGIRPIGAMSGYQGDPDKTTQVTRGGHYHTGDTASRDADGYLTYIGRVDDVFKASDYRISPFELESVLIEHPAVAEAAVVPSPDKRRNAVPKAYVVLASGNQANTETAKSIFEHSRSRLAPYKRVRRLEFSDLPKTISGKIRRVELRGIESAREGDLKRRDNEFWEDDFKK